MRTAESKLKEQVLKVLKEAGAWYWMPVPSGYGRSTLDFIGCYRGYFFAIETKAPGGKPTARQKIAMEEMAGIGEAQVFWGDGPDLLDHIRAWLSAVDAGNYPLLRNCMSYNVEMEKALRDDGEKLRALTGEDHGPYDDNE